jgi:hypothetical protein
MSAFSVAATAQASEIDKGVKRVIVVLTGTASYDTNGSSAAFSSHFSSKVFGMRVLGVTAHGGARYVLALVPAASYGLSPTIKVLDLAAGTPGSEVSSTTDLSGSSWTIEVLGT